MDPISILLIAWSTAAVVFGVCFLWARRIDNFGVVDIIWAAGFTGVTGLALALGHAPADRKILLLVIVGSWSLRLAWHLAVRIARHHPEEDGRYRDLRRKWQLRFGFKMAAFFQAQSFVLVALSWPFIAIASDPAPRFHLCEVIGAMLVLIGLAGEAMADRQLARFKADPSHRGQVCDVGLWRSSRHPNYFFEWVIWIGFSVLAAQAPGGWIGMGCPIFMLYLLLYVTGIPYTEAQLACSKGQAYEQYKAQTSAFIPWIQLKSKK